MLDTRSKYRIIKNNEEFMWNEDRDKLVVQRKRWFLPFYTTLRPFYETFLGTLFWHRDRSVEVWARNRFSTVAEAEQFAKKHALLGSKAWIHSKHKDVEGEVIKELGRLP